MAIATGSLLTAGCSTVAEVLQLLPQTSVPQTSQPSPSTQSTATAQMEEAVRQQINAIRREQGLEELQANPQLAEVARRYSRQMAEENFFSHVSPSGTTLVDRVRSARIPYVMIGENLFKGTNIPQIVPAAVDGWMNSPGHRANILEPQYRETGIGVWQVGNTYYFTQLFLRSFTLSQYSYLHIPNAL